jgi:IclR family transcriptional regulator, KDG regulon repressor
MPTKQIRTIKTCFQILSLFNKMNPILNAEQIARSIGLPKSSVYRYLNSLMHESILEYDSTVKKYALGLKIVELGAIANRRMNLAQIAAPFMEELANKTKETVHLAVLNNGMAMCIKGIESDFPVRLSINPGELSPLYAGATAKILMAYLPPEEQDRVIKKGLKKITENTITDPSKLKKSLEEIRKNGVAYSDQELDSGARAIGAPVFNSLGEVIASLSIAGPIHRFTDKTIADHKYLLVDCSQRISSKLGYCRRNYVQTKSIIPG